MPTSYKRILISLLTNVANLRYFKLWLVLHILWLCCTAFYGWLKVGTGLEINQNYSDIWIRKFKCVSKNPIKKGLKNDFYLDQKWKYFVDCFLQACTRRWVCFLHPLAGVEVSSRTRARMFLQWNPSSGQVLIPWGKSFSWTFSSSCSVIIAARKFWNKIIKNI